MEEIDVFRVLSKDKKYPCQYCSKFNLPVCQQNKCPMWREWFHGAWLTVKEYFKKHQKTIDKQ